MASDELVPVEQLTSVIECTICLETPPESSRVYQCKNGHLYCSECHVKTKDCGVCREPLGNFRNLIVEKVLTSLKGSVKREPNQVVAENGKIIFEKYIFWGFWLILFGSVCCYSERQRS